MSGHTCSTNVSYLCDSHTKRSERPASVPFHLFPLSAIYQGLRYGWDILQLWYMLTEPPEALDSQTQPNGVSSIHVIQVWHHQTPLFISEK